MLMKSTVSLNSSDIRLNSKRLFMNGGQVQLPKFRMAGRVSFDWRRADNVVSVRVSKFSTGASGNRWPEIYEKRNSYLNNNKNNLLFINDLISNPQGQIKIKSSVLFTNFCDPLSFNAERVPDNLDKLPASIEVNSFLPDDALLATQLIILMMTLGLWVAKVGTKSCICTQEPQQLHLQSKLYSELILFLSHRDWYRTSWWTGEPVWVQSFCCCLMYWHRVGQK